MMLHSRETPLSQADTSKKKSPGVPRQSGDARLSDLEAELEQLAMNARRSPQGIFRADPPDQRAQFRIDLRAASKRARFPTPVPHGSRLDANA
jgi:hypothetical protein